MILFSSKQNKQKACRNLTATISSGFIENPWEAWPNPGSKLITEKPVVSDFHQKSYISKK